MTRTSSIRGGDAVLSVRAVRMSPTGGSVTREPISLDVRAGELAMIGVFDLTQGHAVAEACSGLTRPESGTVCVLGQDWSTLDYNAANKLRGRIGRLLTRGRWLEGYSVLDNILLQQLHHGHASRQKLLDRATELARQFGLPGVPTSSPRDMLPEDLQCAGCVRAFIGSPALILLEEPMLSANEGILPPLVNACLEAMYRGAAIVWITRRQDIVRDANMPATQRFIASAGSLTAVAA